MDYEETVDENKTVWWHFIFDCILLFIIIKLFGIFGALVTATCYSWLKSKMSTWGALAVSGVIGFFVATGFTVWLSNL